MSNKLSRPLFVVFEGIDGSGKCLGRGTPILMFDGTTRPVEEIRVGDLLMGDDSRARRVLSLARGRDRMHRIVQRNGESYVVNSAHILCLKIAGRTPAYRKHEKADGVVEMSVEDVNCLLPAGWIVLTE